MNNCSECFAYCICIYEVEDWHKFRTVQFSCIYVLFVYSCPAGQSIKLSSFFFEEMNFEFGLICLLKVVCVSPKRSCLHDTRAHIHFFQACSKLSSGQTSHIMQPLCIKPFCMTAVLLVVTVDGCFCIDFVFVLLFVCFFWLKNRSLGVFNDH